MINFITKESADTAQNLRRTTQRRGDSDTGPEGFVGWLQHSGKTSVNDQKVKGSGLNRDLTIVAMGYCNCVSVLGQYSTKHCSAGRITTAINPQRFICFRKAYDKERLLFFSRTLPGGLNCLLFKGSTCHRASWQPRQSATV
ncbi:hypothetical protein AVEN_156697-1 [Araneus ventricosus]|uniref:Uncharacterized protein n=1 Tax=Araneus ventricosus TaxID=182803 RepID=A0A4Y2SCA2_ARAVE|nr:hypothetical protein AVEN_156697-1 [Araneus ventricosus]